MRFLTLIKAIFGLLLISAVVSAGYILSYGNKDDSEYRRFDFDQILQVFSLNTLSLLIISIEIVFLVLITYWLFRFIRYLFSLLKPKNFQPELLVFPLLLCVVVFSSTINGLIESLIRIYSPVLLELPRRALDVFNGAHDCTANSGDGCAAFVTRQSSEIVTSYFNSIFAGNIFGFNYANLFQMILVFLAVLILFASDRFKLSMKAWGVVSYALVSVFSLFLALSALLAVPLLEPGSPNDEFSAESLEADLKTFAIGFEDFKPLEAVANDDGEISVGAETTPQKGADDTDQLFATTIALLSRIQSLDVDVHNITPEDQSRASFLKGEVGYVQNIYQNVLNDKQQVAKQYANTYNNLNTRREGRIREAVTHFKKESAVRIGNREASNHYLAIIRWFRSSTENDRDALNRCDTLLRNLENKTSSLKTNLVQYELLLATVLQDFEQAPTTPVDARRFNSILAGQSTLENWYRTGLQFNLSDCGIASGRVDNLPVREDYGSSLGMVGQATTWLLESESMPVTLIVGLIGFGMIGALVSRFVRDDHITWGEDAITDSAVIIFSGFVAAIVVYVAAYGGIAIASSQGGDPNPYVVFVACLAGAVYSRDVWLKVKERLTEVDTSETTMKPDTTAKPKAKAKVKPSPTK